VQGGRNEALGGALAAAQRAWSYSYPAAADATPAWQQQQQQFMSRSQAAGQAMLLPDPDAGRCMLGDFAEALSDISEDEHEMTQEEVRGELLKQNNPTLPNQWTLCVPACQALICDCSSGASF
jgi:hypothetical protein